jgi:hypothetical protein
MQTPILETPSPLATATAAAAAAAVTATTIVSTAPYAPPIEREATFFSPPLTEAAAAEVAQGDLRRDGSSSGKHGDEDNDEDDDGDDADDNEGGIGSDKGVGGGGGGQTKTSKKTSKKNEEELSSMCDLLKVQVKALQDLLAMRDEALAVTTTTTTTSTASKEGDAAEASSQEVEGAATTSFSSSSPSSPSSSSPSSLLRAKALHLWRTACFDAIVKLELTKHQHTSGTRILQAAHRTEVAIGARKLKTSTQELDHTKAELAAVKAELAVEKKVRVGLEKEAAAVSASLKEEVSLRKVQELKQQQLRRVCEVMEASSEKLFHGQEAPLLHALEKLDG